MLSFTNVNFDNKIKINNVVTAPHRIEWLGALAAGEDWDRTHRTSGRGKKIIFLPPRVPVYMYKRPTHAAGQSARNRLRARSRPAANKQGTK